MKAQYTFWSLSTESTVLVNMNTPYTKSKHMLIWKLLNFKIRQSNVMQISGLMPFALVNMNLQQKWNKIGYYWVYNGFHSLFTFFIGTSKTSKFIFSPLTYTINYIMKCETRMMFVITNFCLFSSSKVKIYPFLLIFTIHALQKQWCQHEVAVHCQQNAQFL